MQQAPDIIQNLFLILTCQLLSAVASCSKVDHGLGLNTGKTVLNHADMNNFECVKELVKAGVNVVCIFYSVLFEIAVIAVARAKCNTALCGALPLPPSLTAVRAELPYTNIYSAGARRQFWRIWMSLIDQKYFIISAKFT